MVGNPKDTLRMTKRIKRPSGGQQLILTEVIERRIYLVRGQKVMLSTDLATLYGVQPRVLVQAVKRNKDRFPEDFMFQLSQQEFAILKSQIVISSWGGLRRAIPSPHFSPAPQGASDCGPRSRQAGWDRGPKQAP